MPFGTRGGISGEYIFPADGEYALHHWRPGVGARTCRSWNSITPSWHCWMARSFFRTHIGGESDQKAIDQQQQVAVSEINGRLRNVRFHAPQGQHRVAVTLCASGLSPRATSAYAGNTPEGRTGARAADACIPDPRPHSPSLGMSDSPTRAKIFLCHPVSAAEEAPCARRIIEHLARPRLPTSPSARRTCTRCWAFTSPETRNGGFEGGHSRRTLRHPREPLVPSTAWKRRRKRNRCPRATAPVGTLSDLTLSLALCRSSCGAASRMRSCWASPKATSWAIRRCWNGKCGGCWPIRGRRPLVDGFAFPVVEPRETRRDRSGSRPVPLCDRRAGSASRYSNRSSRCSSTACLRSDQPVTALLTADYTYLNESLAMLYGMEGRERWPVSAGCSSPDSRRWGTVGKGSDPDADRQPGSHLPGAAWRLDC